MHVFIDTMVFLHYQDIGAIDFCEIYGAEEIAVVVPRVIVRELDSHKDSHSSNRARNRARRGLNLIESSVENSSIRDGVVLEVILDHPDINYKDYGLSESINDDQFVAAVISFIEKNPTYPIAVVSNDTGVRLKCRQIEVDAAALPDKYKLDELLDPNEQEVRRMKLELQKLKSAQPKLELIFQQSQTAFAEFDIIKSPVVEESEIQRLLEEKRAEYPRLKAPAGLIENSIISSAHGIPKDEYQRYEKDRNKFLKQYEKYAQHELEYARFLQRTIKFNLELKNNGTQPAEDIDVHMHFPDGFGLWEDDDFPKLPNAPKPPQKPRTQIDLLTRGFGPDLSSLRPHIPAMHYPHSASPVKTFSLNKTNGFDVREQLPLLKHGLSHNFPSLCLTFVDRSTIKSFQCEFELHVANMVEPTCGKLNFVFKVSEE